MSQFSTHDAWPLRFCWRGFRGSEHGSGQPIREQDNTAYGTTSAEFLLLRRRGPRHRARRRLRRDRHRRRARCTTIRPASR